MSLRHFRKRLISRDEGALKSAVFGFVKIGHIDDGFKKAFALHRLWIREKRGKQINLPRWGEVASRNLARIIPAVGECEMHTLFSVGETCGLPLKDVSSDHRRACKARPCG